jgi:hypothetical protein
VIAIEEVWNKFLLSPLEMAKYIDGKVLFYGYPRDWIHTLEVKGSLKSTPKISSGRKTGRHG